VSRFSRLFSKNRRYDDISVSIQEHLDERVEELMEEGMSRDVAERIARVNFGNVTLVQERSREVWQWQRLESLLVDLKHVCRRLSRSPGFAITVVLTLAIGIGANTAVFSVLNSVLLRPLPYSEPEQLVSLHLNAPGAPGLSDFRNELRLSASMYLTFAAHNRAFQSVGVWGPGGASITGIAQPEQVNTALVSSGVLETLNVPAFSGQWLTEADQDPHALGRVMLSYGYWQRRFGGDPGVVGRTISVNSQPRVVAGVMPRGFKVVNYDFDLLVPMAFDPLKQPLAGFAYRGIARLRSGVSLAQANADVAGLLNVWMDSWTNPGGGDPHWYLHWKITPALQPLKETVVGSIQTVLWVVMTTIGVVMLIACECGLVRHFGHANSDWLRHAGRFDRLSDAVVWLAHEWHSAQFDVGAVLPVGRYGLRRRREPVLSRGDSPGQFRGDGDVQVVERECIRHHERDGDRITDERGEDAGDSVDGGEPGPRPSAWFQ